MVEIDPYLIIMIALAFIMSFSIGSNETDALAMSYSSNALTLF
jgi:phosphate/sulfate permease